MQTKKVYDSRVCLYVGLDKHPVLAFAADAYLIGI